MFPNLWIEDSTLTSRRRRSLEKRCLKVDSVDPGGPLGWKGGNVQILIARFLALDAIRGSLHHRIEFTLITRYALELLPYEVHFRSIDEV
jgi:hypothetical protein